MDELHNLPTGLDWIDSGSIEPALHLFEVACKASPNDPKAWYGLGRAHFAKREFEDAIECFDQAVRFELNDPDVNLFRAWCGYFNCACEEDRIEDANRVLEVRPENAAAWFLIGDALADLGDHESAIAHFEKCISIKPDWCEPYYHWARVLSEMGDELAAKEMYKTSAKYPTTDQNLYHHRAHWFALHDEPELALLDFDGALAIAPDSDWHLSCREAFLKWLDPSHYLESPLLYSALEEVQGNPMMMMMEKRYQIFNLLQEHFGEMDLDEIEITERTYSFRAGPDLQIALNTLEANGFEIKHFFATRQGNNPVEKFSEAYMKNRRNPVLPVSPSYEEFDIGEDKPLRCLKDGVWLLRSKDVNFHLLLYTANYQGIKLEAAVPKGENGQEVVDAIFGHISQMIKRSQCYRGKVLSLEQKEKYSGTSALITVHKLRQIEREHVVLPPEALDLIDRNVLRFVDQRPQLKKRGISTKKGLLFYGPPGTGKTHSIQFLARALQGHTMLIITAEQMGELSEYMTLARLYEPSVLVIEDVDLIARDRETLHNPAQELLLNKLLNEMDGTKPDADIIFILTTNRPSALESALTARRDGSTKPWNSRCPMSWAENVSSSCTHLARPFTPTSLTILSIPPKM